jgi:membrane protein
LYIGVIMLRNLMNLIVETIKEWQEDGAARLAAALAYYTTFSLAPLLVVVIAIAGLLGGRDAAQSLVMDQVEDLVGREGREFVVSMIDSASSTPTGVAASILGTATLLIGALGAFNELQNALNRIWDVEPKPIIGLGKQVLNFIFKRLLSFSMLLGIGFLLLVALVVSAGLSAIDEFLRSMPLFSSLILQILNLLISLGLITLLFALIFKFVPDVDVSWKSVWLGAAITAIFFTIGKQLIGLYLGRSDVGNTFGAAGSMALIMIWVYYSSQILFLGAEFTQVYAKKFGEKYNPDEHAVEANRKNEASPEKSTRPAKPMDEGA